MSTIADGVCVLEYSPDSGTSFGALTYYFCTCRNIGMPIVDVTRYAFEDVGIEPTRVYTMDDTRTFLTGDGHDADALAQSLDGTFMSAFIRATKRAPASCCGSTCCQ